MKVGTKKIILIGLYVLFGITATILVTRFNVPIIHIVLGSVFAGGLYVLVRWNSKHTAYICPKCNNEFTISTLTDFISPHMVTTKLLKCPSCGKLSWCHAIDKD